MTTQTEQGGNDQHTHDVQTLEHVPGLDRPELKTGRSAATSSGYVGEDDPVLYPKHDHSLPASIERLDVPCGPSQHNFRAGNAGTTDQGIWEPVIYCRNCGETRKLEVPS